MLFDAFMRVSIKSLTLCWPAECSALLKVWLEPCPPQGLVLSLLVYLSQRTSLLVKHLYTYNLFGAFSFGVMCRLTNWSSQPLLKPLLEILLLLGVVFGKSREQETNGHVGPTHTKQHSTSQLTDVQGMIETDGVAVSQNMTVSVQQQIL